jgi:predicted dehydrogenase
MKQVLRRGFADIVVERVPDPVAGPGMVLVRPLYSLISSGTETASIHQEGVLKEVAENPSHMKKVYEVLKGAGPAGTYAELKARFSAYAVLGYSGAGIVVDKHASVHDLELGARVAYGGEGTGHGETIAVGRNLVARVPDGVPLEEACFTTLGAIAMNAVRIAEIGLGESVAVIGLGLVGQLIAQLARCQGGVVIGSDLRPERAALARELGTAHTISGSLREGVDALTQGRGADCVIIAAAAKSAGPAQAALEAVRDRGRIVVVGAIDMHFPWNAMYLKEVEVRMSRAYGPGSYDESYEKKGQDYPLPYVRWTENRNMEEFLRLRAGGQARIAPLISHRFPLDKAAEAYGTILAPGSQSLAVVLEYPAAAEPDALAGFRPERRVEIAAEGRGENAPSGELRFALVGAGNIAKWAHLPALKKIPGVRWKTIQTSVPAKAREYAERFGASEATTELQSLWQDPELDAVAITNRNARHAPDALAALAAGKHVFVEKPMALTREDCVALEKAVRVGAKTLFVGFNRRFAPFYVALKKTLSARQGPAVVQARVNSPGISGAYWMADPAIGGAILGEACHFFDLFYWLLESEPVEVTAWTLPSGINNMTAQVRMADGSLASLAYTTVGSKTSGGERVEAFLDGMAAGTEDFKRFWKRGRAQKEESFWFGRKGYDEEMAAFVRAIREGGPSPVGVRDGARATMLCLEALESAARREPRALDLDAWLRRA